MDDIEFHFDFGSPNAYLAHRVIPEIEGRTGVRFRYVPILLGGVFKATNNRSPMEAFKDIGNKRAFMELETRRFLAQHDITDFQRNPYFPVNTLTLMRGAVAARHEACFDRYVDIVFHNMWCEPKKLDDPAVIRAVLLENGLDADRLLDLAQSAAVKQELAANTAGSVMRGTFGSPTFFVGDEMFFGKDQLRDVEEVAVRVRGDQPAATTFAGSARLASEDMVRTRRRAHSSQPESPAPRAPARR